MIERLAYISPLPPARTGIADYSRALLPALARRVAVTVYSDAPDAIDPALSAAVDVQPLAAYDGVAGAQDATLFQLGNSAHHADAYDLFRAQPGIAVLHDTIMHHFVERHTRGRGDEAAYARALGYAHGAAGLDLAADVRHGRLAPLWQALPLIDGVVDRALGIIVHSEHARDAVRRVRADRPVVVVPALIETHAAPARRAALGWPATAVIFATAGQLTRNKQIESLLRVVAAARHHDPRLHVLLIGESVGEVDVDGLVLELGLAGVVHQTGFVPDLATFAGWIAAADIVVNLRHPTNGETSATALRALAAGRPLVVNDHGWYAELPDSVALKVAPGDDAALERALRALAAAPDQRERMGQAATAVAAAHDPDVVAAHYLDAVETIVRHALDRPAPGWARGR